MPSGIYIHIPFCRKKCPYCDFYSVVSDSDTIHKYVLSLVRNISSFESDNAIVDTVYFGGGTPSLVEPSDISLILDAVKRSFLLSEDPEITLEANPCTVDLDRLSAYRKAGINRISFGVQSANDNELSSLGRLHDFSLAEQAVLSAQTAGFSNISCDLMIGTPNQTLESLKASIRRLASLQIQHISAYMLKIEEGTAFDCDSVRRSVADDDTVSDMYLSMCRELESLDYNQYEISNFSLSGYESRHNLKYWHLDDYIGFGTAAHSLWKGKRFYVPSDLKKYLSEDIQPIVIEDDSPDPLEEYIMLSLRLAEGLSLSKVDELGGNSQAVVKTAEQFISSGLARLSNGRLFFTPEGFLVSNEMILKIIMSQG